jgi:hypothetical protein
MAKKALTRERFGARFAERLPSFGFSRLPTEPYLEELLRGSRWTSHRGLVVISSRVDAELPGTDHLEGPQWQLSVSSARSRADRTMRPTDVDMLYVVDAFTLPAFDEDNHHPGIARHLWCPIDERYRSACECKVNERLVVEPDGYQWTTDDSKRCRGCDYAELSQQRFPCTLHGRQTIARAQ